MAGRRWSFLSAHLARPASARSGAAAGVAAERIPRGTRGSGERRRARRGLSRRRAGGAVRRGPPRFRRFSFLLGASGRQARGEGRGRGGGPAAAGVRGPGAPAGGSGRFRDGAGPGNESGPRAGGRERGAGRVPTAVGAQALRRRGGRGPAVFWVPVLRPPRPGPGPSVGPLTHRCSCSADDRL